MARRKGCTEIVARTPVVVMASDTYQRDPTHLQFCGRPVKRNGKCARHLKRPNSGLTRAWQRFLRREAHGGV